MAFSVTSTLGERLAAKLAPWLTEDLGRFLQAIGTMFDSILDLAEEEGIDGEPGYVPAWGKLLDPTLCPADALPYLGQFVGVEVPKVASEEEARSLVKNEPAMERGTLGSIEAAIRKSLTGTKAFRVVERQNGKGEEDGYWFLILIFDAEELPSEQALIESVNAVKPGGVFFTVIIGGFTYAVLEAAHGTYGELEAAHTTYEDMEVHPTK